MLSTSARRLLLRSAASQRPRVVPSGLPCVPSGRWSRVLALGVDGAARQQQQRRGMAMHASILSRMELLSARYDELAAELSKCVCQRSSGMDSVMLGVADVLDALDSNDGSMEAERITSLSIEMADLEPKALAVRELRGKQQAVQELDEVCRCRCFTASSRCPTD